MSTHGDNGHHQQGRVESWVVMGLDPDSPQSSWRGELCERTGPSLYGAAGLSRRNFSKRKSEKRDTQGLFGEFSCSSRSNLLTTQPHCAPMVARKALSPPRSPRENARPNLQDRRLLGNWAGDLPSAATEGRSMKPISLQPAAARKTSKTDLASLNSLKPARGIFF